MPSPRVFFSHSLSKRQRAWCDQLAAALTTRDFAVWSDAGHRTDAQEWAAKRLVEMERYEVYLLALTPAWWRSRWTQAELAMAFTLDMPILAIALTPTPDAREFAASHPAFASADGPDEVARQIASALERLPLSDQLAWRARRDPRRVPVTPRFDGVYQAPASGHARAWYYLRFQPGGAVATVTALDTPAEALAWYLSSEGAGAGRGCYRLDGDRIRFACLTAGYGTVAYSGLVTADGAALELDSLSYINGNRERVRYTFTAVAPAP